MNRYLRINQTRLGPTGLFNQVTHLLDAIAIAKALGRKIYRPKFLPSYNSLQSIDWSEVIQLEKFGGLFEINEKIPEEAWNFAYHNKVTSPLHCKSLDQAFQLLQGDPHPHLDLGSCYRLEPPPDPESIKYLKFQPIFYEVANYCQEKYLGQAGYGAVHFRLEDDWIEELQRIYQCTPDHSAHFLYRTYLRVMKDRFKKDQKIFLATHLTKSPNRYNHLVDKLREEFPNIVVKIDWREEFTTVPLGREIDAIIDFLIALQSESFVGVWESVFSRTVDKLHTDAELFDMRNYFSLPFEILNWSVGYDRVGVYGKMGSEGELTLPQLAHYGPRATEFDLCPIFAHAPSQVTIKTKIPVVIEGYLSPTAKTPGRLQFKIDGVFLGELEEAGQRTPQKERTPGVYQLTVSASSLAWGHSAWLFKVDSHLF